MLLNSLPAEIRLQIYSYVTPDNPLAIPAKEFSGLLYSCKAIRQELEPDVCKAIAACIIEVAARIQRIGDEVLYTPPTTLQGWLNLTISRPKTAHMFTKDDPYLDFKYLYFNTLTITFHNDAEGYEYYRERPETYQRAACNLAAEIGKWQQWEEFPAMRNWVLDWSAYPQYGTGKSVEGSLHARMMYAWEVESWMDDRGVLTDVCFFRKEKEGMGTMLIDERNCRG